MKYFNTLKTGVSDPGCDGYGRAAMNVFKVMKSLGWIEENNRNHNILFIFSTPKAVYWKMNEMLNILKCKKKYVIAFTMWEASKLPKGWEEGLNQVDLIITPSRYCADIFKNNGVRTEIRVLPIPIEVADFPLKIRDTKRFPFHFIQYAQLTKRKGWHFVLRAFQEEFKIHEPVKLTFKSKIGIPISCDDPRVSAISEVWTQKQMTKFLHDGDAFMNPSMGEGYGMPDLEAMATGLPVISMYEHALKEHLSEDTAYLLTKNEAVKVSYEDYFCWPEEFAENESMGYWYKPNITEIRSKMREVYNAREEAFGIGLKAAKFVRENYSMQALKEKIKETFSDVFN